MTVPTSSSLPRVINKGIKDDTPVPIVAPVESLPIRLPLFLVNAPWGEYDRPRYVDTAAVTTYYGAETLQPLSKWFNHQSLFLRSQLSNAGKALTVRMKMPGAKQAQARFAVDLIADQIPLWKRNADNSIRLDAQGNKIPTGETALGWRLQHRKLSIGIDAATGESTFGAAVKSDGTLTSSIDGGVSALYPVMDEAARFEGGKGNNLGSRLIARTINSNIPADETVHAAVGSYVYTMQFVQRADSASTATQIRTINSAPTIDFTFKKGTINKSTGLQYSADKVIIPAYESTDPLTFTGFGPLEKLHVYNASITELLTLLAAAEDAHLGNTEPTPPDMINFLTGVDINGNPYHTLSIEGPEKGGLMFGESSNHYMLGGDDGDTSVEAYNEVVDTLLSDLSASDVPFASIALMPYDSVFDSGFPVETKLKFAAFHNLRPDVMPHICTQDVLKRLNTPEEDASIGITLRSTFRSLVESTDSGTPTTRVCFTGNAGYLINDDYDGLVPFMEYLLILGAKYLGAEDGEMKSNYSFGKGEKTTITRYRDHNVRFRTDEARNPDWNNGLNLAIGYDMSRLFWPGVQSIHENHTSILHSYLNVVIACNLTRIGNIVWREQAGDDETPDDVFLDDVNAKVIQKTTGKYDGRVDVTPNAYYNAEDAGGFSWHLDIGMAGQNMKTVERLQIIAQRRRNASEGEA